MKMKHTNRMRRMYLQAKQKTENEIKRRRFLLDEKRRLGTEERNEDSAEDRAQLDEILDEIERNLTKLIKGQKKVRWRVTILKSNICDNKTIYSNFCSHLNNNSFHCSAVIYASR